MEHRKSSVTGPLSKSYIKLSEEWRKNNGYAAAVKMWGFISERQDKCFSLNLSIKFFFVLFFFAFKP